MVDMHVQDCTIFTKYPVMILDDFAPFRGVYRKASTEQAFCLFVLIPESANANRAYLRISATELFSVKSNVGAELAP